MQDLSEANKLSKLNSSNAKNLPHLMHLLLILSSLKILRRSKRFGLWARAACHGLGDSTPRVLRARIIVLEFCGCARFQFAKSTFQSMFQRPANSYEPMNKCLMLNA